MKDKNLNMERKDIDYINPIKNSKKINENDNLNFKDHNIYNMNNSFNINNHFPDVNFDDNNLTNFKSMMIKKNYQVNEISYK